MGTTKPDRTFYPIKLGGVLDESVTPTMIGGGPLGSAGLTSCANLIYRRFGAWGKRAGSGPVYAVPNGVLPPKGVPNPLPPPGTPAPPTPIGPAPRPPGWPGGHQNPPNE
jgi:hypothetical protein